MSDKPTILCVDDEVNILEGLKINLRKTGRILTAESGKAGLQILQDNPDIAVVISDMRMPEMDGATFLSKAVGVSPESVRILLTGFSDMEAAVRAVNEGQLFRFLTKPCPPEMLLPTVEAALRQHELITAEKVLLQRTLLGSVRALIEIMALSHPQAMGRAMRIRRRVRQIAGQVGLSPAWPAELASIFSQLAMVSLKPELSKKMYSGDVLDDVDALKVSRSANAVTRIIGKIPRLGPAISILKSLNNPVSNGESLAVRVVRSAMLIETAESRGLSPDETDKLIAAGGNTLGDELLTAISDLLESDAQPMSKVAFAPDALEEGMILADDLETIDGLLLAPRGWALNAAGLEHIRAFSDRIEANGVRVLVVADPPRQEKKQIAS